MIKNKIKERIVEKKVMRIVFLFVLLAIITMSIAYAVLSTTLNITGRTEVLDASWNMELEELIVEDYSTPPENATVSGNVISYGNAQLIIEPTIVDTQIINYKISFGKVGDSILLEYKLTNTGTIPAKVVSSKWKDYVISSETNNQEDIQLVNDYFNSNYELYELILNNGKIVDSKLIEPGDILCPGAVFAVQISHSYSVNAPRVPYGKTTISNLGVEFDFEAADKKLCNGSTYVG